MAWFSNRWENIKNFFRQSSRNIAEVWHWFTPLLNTVGKLLVSELSGKGLSIIKALVSKYDIMDLVGSQKRKRVLAEAKKLFVEGGLSVKDYIINTN